MSQIIPGGRPRASSDGDILDEGFCGGLVTNRQSDIGDSTHFLRPGRQKDKVKQRNSPTKTGSKSTESEVILSENGVDVFDSDGGISSQSTESVSKAQKRTRRLSFKSMKKAVSRAFVKDSHHVSSSSNTDSIAGISSKSADHSVITYSGKIWTPELRRIGKSCNDMNGTGGHHPKSTMSSARPLVMEPEIEMTIPKWKNVPGTLGIYNHGNSCFINTILQCLGNTDSFTEYFVQEFFKNDLKQNRNNKKSVFRSSHGEVTEQLAYLLKSLWCGNYHGDISKEFKAVAGKYNDQYRGDHQHDAQEFLLWLLDRLHEDLCSPPKKKPKPQKAVTSKSEEEISMEALAANGDSFVLKLFQALHSSTLTCPSCGDRSSTFDPYLCVSLPLPQSCPRVINVIIVTFQQFPKEVKYAFTLNQFDCVKELRDSIASETGFSENQFILCQLKDDGFGATYSNEQPLTDIAENETIYAIETYSDEDSIESDDPEFDSPQAQVLIVHVDTPEGSSRNLRFGEPSLLKVSRDITWKELQRNVLLSMNDAVYPDILPQKLSPLFSLKIWDGSSSSSVLPSDVEMPLYTQAAERALNTLSEDFGPNHIKILAIWDTQTKDRVIKDDKEHIKINQSVRNVNTNPPTHVSLDECFRLYTQEEKLNGDDAWLCPHCKEQQQGTLKSLGLWSLPDVLILHLKRFKQTSLRRSKLNTLVEFPVDNLNMSPHLANKAKNKTQLKPDDYTYDLIGVSNHFGNMMGGHYTAFCRSPVDGQWREFNDTKVMVLEGSVATKEAYILFYQRRSLSKDINQKLFMGDHWVFSLPLSSINKIEEPVSSTQDQDGAPATPRTRRTRSRSSSPLSHRHANGASRLPSPLHSPMSSRPSRPLSRQNSSSSQATKRGRSANAAPSSKASSQSHVTDSDLTNGKTVVKDKRVKDNYSSIGNRKPAVTVVKHIVKERDTGGFSESKDKENLSSSVASNKSNLSHSIPSTNTMRDLKQIRPSSYHDNELHSDAKYPVSSHFSSVLDKENRSANNSSRFDFPYESAGALRVNIENIDGPVSSRSSNSSSYLTKDDARRRLADLKKEHSSLSQNGHAPIHTLKSSSRNTHERRYHTQTSYDISRNNPVLHDLETLSLTEGSSEKLKPQRRDVTDYLTSEMHHHDLFLKQGRDCSTLEEEPENFSLYPSETHITESSLPSRLGHGRFADLATKHFGEPKFNEHLDRSLEYVPNHRKQPDLYPKYATIARSKEILPSSRMTRDSVLPMPRSSTDQNIYYYGNRAPDLIAPPSPTPPHSRREERSLEVQGIGISRLPARDFSSSHQSYDHHPAYVYDDQTSLASSRFSALYSSARFHPPRGIWGVKAKPSKVQAGLPNPHLRESSV